MKDFSYHGHDPHEVDHEALKQKNDLPFYEPDPKDFDGIDYLLALKEKADKAEEFFLNYESLMVRLCEVLHLDYVEATDEDVIQKVQEMKDSLDWEQLNSER